MARTVALFAAVLSIAGGAEWPLASVAEAGRQHHRHGDCGGARRGLVFYVGAVNRWRDRLDLQPVELRRRPPHSCPFARELAHRWRARSAQHRKRFDRWYARMLAKWDCIHEREGAWDDAGAPYYGGLQMDLSFQRAHGADFLRRYGTADRWPVWAQLVTAERALRVRGWHPWPNTARACGLL